MANVGNPPLCSGVIAVPYIHRNLSRFAPTPPPPSQDGVINRKEVYCQPCYCTKPLSPELFATNLSKNVNNSSLIVYHHLINFHGTFHYLYKFYSRLSYNIDEFDQGFRILHPSPHPSK